MPLFLGTKKPAGVAGCQENPFNRVVFNLIMGIEDRQILSELPRFFPKEDAIQRQEGELLTCILASYSVG